MERMLLELLARVRTLLVGLALLLKSRSFLYVYLGRATVMTRTSQTEFDGRLGWRTMLLGHVLRFKTACQPRSLTFLSADQAVAGPQCKPQLRLHEAKAQ
jgi:hypothetical protein